MKSIYRSLLLIALAWILTYPSHAQEGKKPNIVLVFMDDMGYGDIECYGNPIIRTPNLNRMANEGIRFTSFYAPAPVCTPSRAGLLTGRYPLRNAPNNFGPETEKGLPLGEVTIANLLSDAGYETAAIGKWHLGHRSGYLPTSRGFDYFYGLPYSNDMILPWCPWLTEEDKLHLYIDSTIVKEVGKNQDELILDYTNEAIKFIKKDRDQPFFLYLAHSMPHLPVSAPKKFKGKSNAGVYGDVIEAVDWTMGEMMKVLLEQGIEEETLVIFTSDNGPWHNLPDRMLADGVKDWHTGSSGPFRGAKATTYEGGMRVPAIMHWPNTIPAGQVNRDLASVIDIFPTLAVLAGAVLPANTTLDGSSLLPVLTEGKAFDRSILFYSSGKNLEAVRENEWKLRVTKQDGVQLFNLLKDPSELYNRAEELPEVVDALHEKMTAFAEETGANLHSLGE